MEEFEEGLVEPFKADFEWMRDPEFWKEYAAYKKRINRSEKLTSWMRHIPVVGYYVSSFWYLILAEGIKQTLTPRWGGITFSFLNDGCGATVWHTWQQMRNPSGKYTGIYTKGAPKNRKQAEEWEAKWKEEREAANA